MGYVEYKRKLLIYQSLTIKTQKIKRHYTINDQKLKYRTSQ